MIARAVFLLLIIISAVMIFMFSSQDASASAKTSESVTSKIVKIINPSQNGKTEQEQAAALESIGGVVRKIAHVLEFSFLGIWVSLFISTFSKKAVFMIAVSTAFCMVFAVLDEVHQIFVPGRSCEISDMAIDTVGALIGAAVIYLVITLTKKSVDKGKKT